MENFPFVLTPQINLTSPLGETLNHMISPLGNQSLATSRRGNMAVFNLDLQQVSLSNIIGWGDIWGAALSANGLKALVVGAPDRYEHPSADRWFLGTLDIRLDELLDSMEIGQFFYVFAASNDLQVAMGSQGGEVTWWNPGQRRQFGPLACPHSQPIYRGAVAPSGATGACASAGEAIIWDVATRKIIRSISFPKPKLFQKPELIGSMRFGADHIYLGTNKGKLWAAEPSGALLEVIIDTGHPAFIQVFDIHEQSHLAALLIWGGRLELWDLFSGKLVGWVDTGWEGEATDIRIKPDGASVILAGKDGKVRSWVIQER